MFRNVKELTTEELQKELHAIELFEQEIDKVNVDGLLNKKVDTSFLGPMHCTITPNGQLFRTDFQGFLPEMLQGMYEDRKKFKKMMLKAEQEYENATDEETKRELVKQIAKYKNLQLAKKVGLNSAYGAMGSQYFRFYDLRMAVGVTLAGQLSIRWIENKINQYVNNLLKTDDVDYVIASDTDSIYLNMGPIIERFFKDRSTEETIKMMDKICEEKIQPYIDKSYVELAEYVHAFAQKMQMKREGLADKGIWTAKKRYILNVHNNEGVQYKEPHLKVMGMEMIKSSTPEAVRTRMAELIKIIVNKNESDVQEYIENFRREFKNLSPEEVSFPRGLNGLATYSDAVMLYAKGTPIHVKGAILYNHYLQKLGLTKKYPLIKEGEKIKFTYLKQPNPFKDSVISYPTRLPKEFELSEYVDYDKQFEKTFLEPIDSVLKCVGWQAEKVNTLDSFFI